MKQQLPYGRIIIRPCHAAGSRFNYVSYESRRHLVSGKPPEILQQGSGRQTVFRMTRRTWLGSVAAAWASRRPNIVLMVADDLGSSDLSSYRAADIRTPHIDSIGQEGIRFTHFYSNGPECTPTRAALLTGRYPQRVGGLECAIGVSNIGRYDDAIWLAQRGELGLPSSETSLARMLKASGYATGCFGKWHLGYSEKFSALQHGFDEYFGILGGNADYFTHREEDGTLTLYHNLHPAERRGYLTDLFTEEAIRWLTGRTPTQPFFLYLPFSAPHTPIQDPDGFDPDQGTALIRQGDRRIYAKMVERMDVRVGDILNQLDKMNAAENTMVIFISDNGGDPNGRNGLLRGKKGSTWEGGIRVPCLIRWPEILKPGVTSDQVGLTMDFVPTLLAATHTSRPAGRRLDGINLLPILSGRKPPIPRTVFWRYKRGDRLNRAVRRGDMKLVIENGKEELHNLAQDEREQSDLLPDDKKAAPLLRRLLAEWEKDVMAPRLRPFRTKPG